MEERAICQTSVRVLQGSLGVPAVWTLTSAAKGPTRVWPRDQSVSTLLGVTSVAASRGIRPLGTAVRVSPVLVVVTAFRESES